MKTLFNRFFQKKTDKHWSAFEYFNPKWKNRIFEMSKMISDEEQSILDLGCGKMWLKEYLTDDKIYYGCDYIMRDEATIVCDFSKYEFPSIDVDLCFASGVFEYVSDMPWMMGQVNKYCRVIICSYCSTDSERNLIKRKKQGWRNHFSSDEFIQLIELTGYRLKEKSNKITGNTIYKFVRNK